MPSSFRGRRALLLVGILLAIPVFGAGAAWFWIRTTADRRWEAARLRIQELTRAFPDTLPPHPTTEHSKQLQIHFIAAIREAAPRIGRHEEAEKLVRLRGGGEAVDVVLGDAQDFLDRLHEGARRCAATPTEFPPGWRGELDETSLQFILLSGVLRARRLRESGAAGEAAETILDNLHLARFWAHSGKGDNRVDALHSLDHSLDELRDIIAREPLSRERLLQIDREVEPLDAALQSPSSYWLPALARWSEGLETVDINSDRAPYRWRYLLPENLMKAEAFEFYDWHLQRLLVDEHKSWLELARDVNLLFRLKDDSKNPLLYENGSVVRLLELIGWERMAQLRLLRVAARYRATGEILMLKDPFGTELLHAKTDKRTKFWSLDTDGRDDGGDAGTDGRWNRRAKDIVIDVPINE